MSVLTQEQTSAAVRAMIYFGAHDYNGQINLGDCRATMASEVAAISPPSSDKNDPLEEFVRVTFKDVEVRSAAVNGVIKVEARIGWQTLYERLRVGSPNYSIIAQPKVVHEGLTKNCLIAWSRLISKHNYEVETFREHSVATANDKASSGGDAA